MIRPSLLIWIVLAVGSTTLPRPVGTRAEQSDLAGHRFVSVSVAQSGTEVRLVETWPHEPARVWIHFWLSTLAASGGCNMTSGASWALDDGVLHVINNGGMTLIGCGPLQDAQDHWWLNFLGASPVAQWDSAGRLQLVEGDTIVTMVEELVKVIPGGRPPG